MKLTDDTRFSGTTEIELVYNGYTMDLFDLADIGYDVPERDDDDDDFCNDEEIYEVDDVKECIRAALDWKYSVGDFENSLPDKDAKRVYVDGREIDAYSDIAKWVQYDGYDPREYKEHEDDFTVTDSIHSLKEYRTRDLAELKVLGERITSEGKNPNTDRRYESAMWKLAMEYKSKVSDELISLAKKGVNYKSLHRLADSCSGDLTDCIEYMPDIELSRACEHPDKDMNEFAYLCLQELTKRRTAKKHTHSRGR